MYAGRLSFLPFHQGALTSTIIHREKSELFTESTKVKLAGLGEKDKRLLLLALRFEKPLTPMKIANEVNPKTVHNWIKEWLRIGLLEPASGNVRVRFYKVGKRYQSITIEELGFTEKDN